MYTAATRVDWGMLICQVRVCIQDSNFIPIVLLIYRAVTLLRLVCHTNSSEVEEGIRILSDPSQDTVTVYIRLDHCCYRSRVVRVEIHSETVTSFTDLLIEDVLTNK